MRGDRKDLAEGQDAEEEPFIFKKGEMGYV